LGHTRPGRGTELCTGRICGQRNLVPMVLLAVLHLRSHSGRSSSTVSCCSVVSCLRLKTCPTTVWKQHSTMCAWLAGCVAADLPCTQLCIPYRQHLGRLLLLPATPHQWPHDQQQQQQHGACRAAGFMLCYVWVRRHHTLLGRPRWRWGHAAPGLCPCRYAVPA
jgi:hypothetical protein